MLTSADPTQAAEWTVDANDTTDEPLRRCLECARRIRRYNTAIRPVDRVCFMCDTNLVSPSLQVFVSAVNV